MLFDPALRKRTSGLTAVTVALALALSPLASVRAEDHENKGPPVLRDTETEQLLREYTRPILRVAGLEKQNIQMVIINDPSFNAFVADGRRIFVNYGAILKSETPNQIIGVQQLFESSECTGKINSPKFPILANEDIREVVISILNQLVEDSYFVHLLVPDVFIRWF